VGVEWEVRSEGQKKMPWEILKEKMPWREGNPEFDTGRKK
jgi:hypothetical protein